MADKLHWPEPKILHGSPAPVVDKYFLDDKILVVRDDLLPGGTKSVLLPYLTQKAAKMGAVELVYASPVQGAFQIALAYYCQQNGIKCTIFCGKRAKRHKHTIEIIRLGANVQEIPPCCCLNVLTSLAKKYTSSTPGAMRVEFGGRDEKCITIISERVRQALNYFPQGTIAEIWCAIGSGTLCEAILEATNGTNIKVVGVSVGKTYNHTHPRLRVIKYPRPFDWESKINLPFPSTPHYDRKAFSELIDDMVCYARKGNGKILFWNVY